MSNSDEFDEAWKRDERGAILRKQLATGNFIGKFGQARKREKEEQLRAIDNFLTPPPKRIAIAWHRQVSEEAWRAFRADNEIEFRDLLDAVMALNLPVPVEEEAVRRYLNKIHFRGEPGQAKKTIKVSKP